MLLLLDSQAALWLLDDSPRLGTRARQTITAVTTVHVSAATIWQLTIKAMLGKLSVPDKLASRLSDQGLVLLSITAEHAEHAEGIRAFPELIRHDPFGRQVLVLNEPTFGEDRARARQPLTLLAELRAEGCTIVTVTHDLQLAADHAAHIAVLTAGRLIAHGMAAEPRCGSRRCCCCSRRSGAPPRRRRPHPGDGAAAASAPSDRLRRLAALRFRPERLLIAVRPVDIAFTTARRSGSRPSTSRSSLA